MRKSSVVWLAMATLAMLAVPVIAQDNLDGSWPSVFGGMYGTARAPFPVIFEPGGRYEVAWKLAPDPNGINFTPPPNASQIVFDSEGNLYWHSIGFWSADYVASCTPQGVMRWVGPPETLGHLQTDNSPVVGEQYVYMLGMFDPNEYDPNNTGWPKCEYTGQLVFALNKANGTAAWTRKLDNESYCPEQYSNNAQPSPILYNGRLFVMGIPDPANGVAVYQINATNGQILGNNPVAIKNKMCGNMCLLPNRFGAGVHGLYVLKFDDWNAEPPQIFGLRVDTNTNTTSIKWESDPNYGGGYELGFLDWGTWGHVMYNPTTDRIYAYTEDNSWGYEFFSFDPNAGDDLKAWGDSGDWPFTSAQFQTGALDFDDTRILTGAYDGGFTMYADDGSGNIAFVDALQHLSWGHPRQFVQLLYDTATESTVAVTGTAGIDSGLTHIMMCDLDNRDDPAEDGPMYIDDIEVYQGPDTSNLTLVWSENFESYSAGSPPGGGWTLIYGGDQSAPLVVDDPTQGTSNKVLAFDPVPPSDPNDPGAWWGHGAYHSFTQTTDKVIVTRYRQWMQDSSEAYELMWGADPNDYSRGFAYGSEWNNRRCTLEWLGEWDPWYRPNYQVEQTWEDVTYTYDFPGTTASVQLADRDQVDSDWTGQPFAPAAKAAGFGITMWHNPFGDPNGVVSDNWPRLRVNYLHDVRNSWQDVNALGGPIVGPDGKIYFFSGTGPADPAPGDPPPDYYLPRPANPGWLIALQPACRNPGASGFYCTGDIYPNNGNGFWEFTDGDGDCVVNISDLGAMLPNYNQPGTFTREDGDIYPEGAGDGLVNISDLGLLLAQYHDNCN